MATKYERMMEADHVKNCGKAKQKYRQTFDHLNLHWTHPQASRKVTLAFVDWWKLVCLFSWGRGKSKRRISLPVLFYFVYIMSISHKILHFLPSCFICHYLPRPNVSLMSIVIVFLPCLKHSCIALLVLPSSCVWLRLPLSISFLASIFTTGFDCLNWLITPFWFFWLKV